MSTTSVAYLVDSEALNRQCLCAMIEAQGYQVVSFSSAEEFLRKFQYRHDTLRCLLLKLELADVNGLDLQRRLLLDGVHVPTIFLTMAPATDDVVSAVRQGAVDFLELPVTTIRLLHAIRSAFDVDRSYLQVDQQRREIRERIALLSDRERETMEALWKGKMTKEIAMSMEIGYQTAAKHRSAVFQKLQVRNEVELVRLLDRLRSPSPDTSRLWQRTPPNAISDPLRAG